LASSRRDAFEAYHTQVLWAWGADHAGWTVGRASSNDRERILTTLSTAPGVHMPTGAADMEKCWRRMLKPEKTDPFPAGPQAQDGQSHQGAEEEEEESQEDEKATEDADGAGEKLRLLRAEQTIARLSAELAASRQAQPPASESRVRFIAAPSAAAPQQAKCTHCKEQQMVDDPSDFRCRRCGLDPNLSFGNDTNVFLRDLQKALLATTALSASTASGQSHTSQTSGPAASPPTKRDREFERLATERPQLQRFALTAAVSAQEALRVSRLSYAATEYAPASVPLLRLVQSGSLMKVNTLPFQLELTTTT
jgi:hypothetical protein